MTLQDKFIKKLRVAAGVAVFLLVCGCAVHEPREATLNISPPDAFVQQPVPGKSIPDTGNWWETFNDPTLNRLIDLALKNNLDLSQAFSRLRQLEAIAQKSRSVRLPRVSLSGSASRSRQLGAAGEVTGNSYSLSVAAGYEVDLWRRLASAADAREFEAWATAEDINSLYLTISARVADFYYLIVAQRAQLELVDRTVAARTDTLDLVETRFREGMAPALDLYQARQNLAGVGTRRPGIEASLARSAHALSILLASYPNPGIGGDLAALPDMASAFPAGLPSQLLIRRPDIRAQLLRVSAADRDIGVAVADRFPSVNLLADAGKVGTDFGTSLSATIWSMAGNLAMPIIDWGGRKAEVARTEAVFAEQLAEYQQTVLTAFREVEDALVNNRTDMETIHRLEIQADAAESAMRLSTDRYLDGLSDYLPVLDAQTRHFDVESALLSARQQLISDRISLARALGGNWVNPASDDPKISGGQLSRK
ncbi:MAG: efflux transporter outer membrane subunit [Deltaproteobacteria bacterium]|nr:efflux transporter outer membrane subunit [Deltaproteobacteria bacterium]